jgi:hypothetical protein
MYAVLHMGWPPSRFAELWDNEKAFVIASIQAKLEAEDKAKREAKHGHH